MMPVALILPHLHTKTCVLKKRIPTLTTDLYYLEMSPALDSGKINPEMDEIMKY